MHVPLSMVFFRAPALRVALVAGLLGMAACKGSTGSEGPAGPAGPQGPEGPAGGPQGPQGLSALLLTTPEPAGTNCAFGGVRLQAGVDSDRSGALEGAELDSATTRYICNGATGATGTTGPQGERGLGALVATEVELAGSNCAHGGTRLLAGVDRDGDGTLDGDEVDAASTKYLCNGAPGPQGPQGATGPQGPTGETGLQGPQGESGALALYGDGSAGDFTLQSFQQPRYFQAGNFPLPAGANLMFRNVTIDGTLIVSSGTMIRATGDIIIGQSGSIIVSPDFQIQTLNPPQKGIAMSAAWQHLGGRGLDLGRTSLLSRADLAGGGSGYRSTTNADILGGDGGGRLILAAKGNIIIRGYIDANGRQGINNSIPTINRPAGSPTPVAGGGGGGGGVVSLISRGTITVDTNGRIYANGGNGAVGWNGSSPVAGQMYGGGGGGGGGIIQFLSANTPVIVNSANVQVNGGTAGASAVSGAATSLEQTGGGGGGSAGNGGDGTALTVAAGAAKPGTAGDIITVKAAQPELLFF
ncbi:collagen-like protein [Myxococcus sp. RHSTA-1-4]|uniref:collagen-like protein n=1 Tax=Myxococcus sp. RHSTA-1-4 TaxID=2874601 RepID=UPI001CC0875E|nr:collagen-like protein [Myxococcus sp. RHSTA-1-4]MBZ4421940.1 collagen-like protein [Myxococcus sp. RHSTA-1-4]